MHSFHAIEPVLDVYIDHMITLMVFVLRLCRWLLISRGKRFSSRQSGSERRWQWPKVRLAMCSYAPWNDGDWYWIYPKPRNSGKWRFIGIPYYKCNISGGDFQREKGVIPRLIWIWIDVWIRFHLVHLLQMVSTSNPVIFSPNCCSSDVMKMAGP